MARARALSRGVTRLPGELGIGGVLEEVEVEAALDPGDIVFEGELLGEKHSGGDAVVGVGNEGVGFLPPKLAAEEGFGADCGVGVVEGESPVEKADGSFAVDEEGVAEAVHGEVDGFHGLAAGEGLEWGLYDDSDFLVGGAHAGGSGGCLMVRDCYHRERGMSSEKLTAGVQ